MTNKTLLLLLIPIFIGVWWMITPQEMYVTYASCGGYMGGCHCVYGNIPTVFDMLYDKEYSVCSVERHVWNDNFEVIDNQWRCTGEMCIELGRERYNNE